MFNVDHILDQIGAKLQPGLHTARDHATNQVGRILSRLDRIGDLLEDSNPFTEHRRVIRGTIPAGQTADLSRHDVPVGETWEVEFVTLLPTAATTFILSDSGLPLAAFNVDTMKTATAPMIFHAGTHLVGTAGAGGDVTYAVGVKVKVPRPARPTTFAGQPETGATGDRSEDTTNRHGRPGMAVGVNVHGEHHP